MSLMPADLRFAARSLRMRPGFTLAAVFTLALGIGATTMIFSTVNRVLLNPLPYKGGDRLRYIWVQNPVASFQIWPSPSLTRAWLDNSHSFDGLQPTSGRQIKIERNGIRTAARNIQILPGFLSFLGLDPAAGRMFTEQEAASGGARVALLGYVYWQRELGGRRDIVGGTIRTDDDLYTVVGVMPERLAIFEDAEIWTPLSIASSDSGQMGYNILARLREGVEPEQAQTELDAIAARLPENPLTGWKSSVLTPQSIRGGSLKEPLTILFGAVGMVLLIGCANVALLLLARGASREREIAIRLSLGAGRMRVVRQLLTESTAIAILGGATGTLLAWWGVELLVKFKPKGFSSLDHVSIDVRALLFALALATAAALVSGVIPALRTSDISLGTALKNSGLGSGGATGNGRLRAALIAGEMTMSVMLLVGAGLLIRSLIQYQRADLGFSAKGLLTVQAELPTERYQTPESVAAFSAELLDRARQLSVVTDAITAIGAPPDYAFFGLGDLEIQGKGPLGQSAPRAVALNMVSPDYFDVLGIPILKGRSFTTEESSSGLPVVILSKGLAERLFPGERALGKRIRTASAGTKPNDWLTVVGIASDVAAGGLRGATRHLQWYRPYGEGLRSSGDIVRTSPVILRTSGSTAALIPVLQGIVKSMDATLPPAEVRSVSSQYSAMLAGPRFNALLLVIFAALALLLSAVGLFGVLAYTVARRTREIGIRVALGANRSSVRSLVVRQGMIPALVGLVLGAAASFYAVGFMGTLVYGIKPRDPAAFAAAAAVLLLTAFTACYIPARRATRVDPMSALRSE
jgi:putative ABC transport system permease protein